MKNDHPLIQPEKQKKALIEEETNVDIGRALIVSDDIAGMKDRYAIKEYKRIFDPTELTKRL